MKAILLFSAVLLITGCDVSYRYPCQDPSNWGKDECRKPLCDLTKDCPEDIYKGILPAKPSINSPAPPAPKGAC